MSQRVLFVTGPTSSGKTSVGISLAKQFNGEVINADARQIFRDAPIGTGIPSGEWDKLDDTQGYFVEGIPHHVMGISGPEEIWTVSRWCAAAKECLDRIWSRGKLPIVVGGTGLYIRALSEGYIFSGEPDPVLRQRLLLLSSEQRLNLFLERQPDAEHRIDLRNPHRVLRALERELSGVANDIVKQPPPFSVIKLGLLWESETLKERVRTTIETQFARGWVEEVRGLLEDGASLDSALMKSIGFQAIANAIKDEIDLDTLKEKVIAETWQYVRRQMTWLRKEPNLKWVRDEEGARSEAELRLL